MVQQYEPASVPVVTENFRLRQVVVPPQFWGLIQHAFARTGHTLVRIPDELLDGDLPTYFMHPAHLTRDGVDVGPSADVVE